MRSGRPVTYRQPVYSAGQKDRCKCGQAVQSPIGSLCTALAKRIGASAVRPSSQAVYSGGQKDDRIFYMRVVRSTKEYPTCKIREARVRLPLGGGGLYLEVVVGDRLSVRCGYICSFTKTGLIAVFVSVSYAPKCHTDQICSLATTNLKSCSILINTTTRLNKLRTCLPTNCKVEQICQT